MDPRACKVDGCNGSVRARGWCNKHYRRWKRSGDPLRASWERGEPETNFWAKVRRDPLSGCWTWTGYVTRDGYGKFIWPGGQLAHRYSHFLATGSSEDGLDLDHACHSGSDCTAVGRSCPHRRCVNPAHLVPTDPVAHKQLNKSGARGKARGAQQRAKTHCPRNHPYDEANTYVDSRGCRNCRACRRKKT